MKSRRALITGITGQDGAYLARFLLSKNYAVYGTFRRLSTPNFWRLSYLGIADKINYISADLFDFSSLIEAIKIAKPDEIYHLAAQSYVGASFDQPLTSGEYTGLAVTRILESIRLTDPQVKYYQASSSEIFGNSSKSYQNENTPFQPQSPYAVAKLYGYWTTKIYRNGYNMFATNGILFNHESPTRGLEFVTRKISNAVARITLGLQKKLVLGNLNGSRDWGYAPEYVEGMWKTLQQKNPDDYVLSTDETHTVKEFVDLAFSHVDLDWKKYVTTDKKLYRIIEVNSLKGDSSKARKELGWNPKVKFKELVKIMINADLERWTRWKKGEHFPWDAYNYIDEKKLSFRKFYQR
ncbi:MAG: GDP-mannose 4,6-dehydratase [Thaumarchaeota archaeon]|nr:GDP-mannose 4,6-dehydratase [Nitrososphaerota archaeon]